MGVALTTVVELELSAGVWTDISLDVLPGMSSRYGINGGGPADRCASAGTFRFRLNNMADNTGHLQGYYSPGHTNCRSGFDIDIKVRWRHPADTYAARSFFYGKIISILPSPGKYAGNETVIEAVDWIDDAATETVSGIDTATAKRMDELVPLVLAGMESQPAAISLAVGDSTFGYAFDNIRDESTRALSALAALAQSEGGYIYLKGDGTLTTEARTDRASIASIAATLDDTMVGFVVSRAKADFINTIQLTIHPRRIDAAATTVLWSRNIANGESPIEIDTGVTLSTLLGAYGDPSNNRARCGGTDMQTPVATTDYQMFANADGTGTNLTANLSVTAALGGNGVAWTLENTGGTKGYITKLQVRGRGIYDRAPVVVKAVDAASVTARGPRLRQIDMPYQDNVNIAQSYADYMISIYSTTGSAPRTVTFWANSDAALAHAAMNVDIGSLVVVAETVTGVSTRAVVNACAFVESDGFLRVTWTLAPSSVVDFWLLGVAGHGELGDVTNLGYL